MPLSNETMDRLMDTHFRYEAADDVEGVLKTLNADAVHDVIGWPNGPAHGRDAARGFYEVMFQDIAGEEVTPLRRVYGPNTLVDESLWKGKATGNPFGLEGRGRPIQFRILHVLEFADDESILREQVWIDFPSLFAQLPQG